MLEIDEAIFVNQLAQGIVDASEGESWFISHSTEDKRRILHGLNFLVQQASPRPEDAVEAVVSSQLRRTLTPCIVVLTPNLKTQLSKLVHLSADQLPQSFRLLILMLSIADARRRKERPIDLANHWWHRDLRDQSVLETIRRENG
jgi:hypothetical protein